MLEVNGLRKSYGDLAAVDGVSLRAGKGETIGLLGPNGAGKTTTVSIIAGLVEPDAGEVRINGRALNGDTDPVKRDIGLVPQPGQHDGISRRLCRLLVNDRGLLIARSGPEAWRSSPRHSWSCLAERGFPPHLPRWLRAITVVFPTRWAMDGLDAVTWRGLGFSAVALPIALLFGCALVFGTIAVMRFRWEAD